MASFFAKQLLRLLAFFLATVLWFYVLNAEPIEAERRVKIIYELPQGKAIASEVPIELHVKVRGARAFLRSLYDQEYAVIDLSKLHGQSDQFTVNVGAENLPSTFGVTVLSITPKSFEVTLDKVIRKEVLIKDNFIGEVAKDYKLISHQFSPNKVMISGPISLMRKITSIRTEAIDLSRLSLEGKIQIPLERLDPRIILEDGDYVSFLYELHSLSLTQNFEAVPVRFISSNRNIVAKDHVVDMSVIVTKNVSSISREDIQAVIDIPERKRGWMKLKVRPILPPDVHLLSIKPEEIMVKVK